MALSPVTQQYRHKKSPLLFGLIATTSNIGSTVWRIAKNIRLCSRLILKETKPFNPPISPNFLKFSKMKILMGLLCLHLFLQLFFQRRAAYDLDMASHGIVRSIRHTGKRYYEYMPWATKKVFFDVGQFYKINGR